MRVGGERVEPDALRALAEADFVQLYGAGELALSAGTQLAEEGYLPHAKIPRQPWTRVDPARLPIMFASHHHWDRSRHIAIVPIPDEILSVVRRLGLDSLPQEMVELQASSAVARGLLTRAMSTVERFVEAGTLPTTIGWSVQTARTPTMTVDLDTGTKTGLHVDSWDRLPLEERQHARNRLCMNLGYLPRYFVYINITLKAIWKLLGKPDASEGFRLGHLFMDRYPDYPVTRLTVEPGCAYIAPTENMLHDGMPAAEGALDMKYTMLGRFMPSFAP